MKFVRGAAPPPPRRLQGSIASVRAQHPSVPPPARARVSRVACLLSLLKVFREGGSRTGGRGREREGGREAGHANANYATRRRRAAG